MTRALAVLLLLLWAAAPASAANQQADLELVLAVDASSSIDNREFDLERKGIATAFRDHAVLAAIRSGPRKRIAVSIVTWAEYPKSTAASRWFVIGSMADAEKFARFAETLPRRLSGLTLMGEGLKASLAALKGNGIDASRQVIDVSGDGVESPYLPGVDVQPAKLKDERGLAAKGGITINGLAILGSQRGLANWYRNNVLTGPESFLVIANSFGDFATAVRGKLIREITYGPKVAEAIACQRSSSLSRELHSPVACLDAETAQGWR